MIVSVMRSRGFSTREEGVMNPVEDRLPRHQGETIGGGISGEIWFGRWISQNGAPPLGATRGRSYGERSSSNS